MDKKITELRLACYVVLGLCFLLIFIAFSTSNWLASDLRVYGAEFVKIGLWEACFRSYVNPEDLNLRRFYAGCRWVLTEEYQSLANILEPPFFVSVQIFFTFCFMAVMGSCVLALAVQLCLPKSKDPQLCRLIGLLLAVGGFCGLIAIIVFGTLGHGREWMPQPEHNYLSWSFGLAVVGVFFMLVAAVLFFVESVQAKKRLRREEGYAMNAQQQTHSKI